MDYLFRWMQLRFLSGHQFDLFTNLAPSATHPQSASASPAQAQLNIPITGTVNPNGNITPKPTAAGQGITGSPTKESPKSLIPEPKSILDEDEPFTNTNPYADRTPPRAGIAPEAQPTIAQDLQARSGLHKTGVIPTAGAAGVEGPASPTHAPDRGVIHTANALQSLIDMGDAPSCATCGAIMTRNGSCYRCMECGSTSGCS